MNDQTPDAFTGCPGFGAQEAHRLALFAQITGTNPPPPTAADGEEAVINRDFLTYCRETGLRLDWLIFGEGSMLRQSADHSPVMALFEEWKLLTNFMKSSPAVDDDDLEPLAMEQEAITTRMVNTTSTSALDWIAKVYAFTERGDDCGILRDGFQALWAEAEVILKRRAQ